MRNVTPTLGGCASPSSSKAWGVDVVDTLIWSGEVRPVEVNGDSLRVLEGEIINGRHAAVRHRDYVALRKAAEGAEPTEQ